LGLLEVEPREGGTSGQRELLMVWGGGGGGGGWGVLGWVGGGGGWVVCVVGGAGSPTTERNVGKATKDRIDLEHSRRLRAGEVSACLMGEPFTEEKEFSQGREV